MSPIKRGDIYYLYVPKQKGGVILRTTGTTSHRIYLLVRGMLARLKAERRWPLLNAIIDGTLTMGAVYDADRTKTLEALEASLSASALAPHVTAYLAWLKSKGKAPRHIENVKQQLAQFTAKYTSTADLTSANMIAWLSGLSGSSGTLRQYCYAVTGLTRHLVAIEVLQHYPLSKVVAPDKNDARMTYVDAATDERIVQAASPQYRALFAFVKGTGCDLSTALNLTHRDFNTAEGLVRLQGTKTANRDVHKALVEAWARPYLEETVVRHFGLGALWEDLTRSGAYHHHARCCEAVGVAGYTLKDSRHSVAVRMAEAGYTAFEIAEQLGTSVDLVAKVYAQFIVKMAHRVTAHVTEAAK